MEIALVAGIKEKSIRSKSSGYRDVLCLIHGLSTVTS